MYQLFTLKNKDSYPLIHDVTIHPFKVNRDPRGTLTEALKTDWPDVFDPHNLPFAQMYYSQTLPDTARDVDRWHYHPGGQQDRFFVISGNIVTAVFDDRPNSPTKGTLNLFYMGETSEDEGQYMVVIPRKTHHGFVVVGNKSAILGNFPTRLYDPDEEKRVMFNEALLPDGNQFSWDKVKELAMSLRA